MISKRVIPNHLPSIDLEELSFGSTLCYLLIMGHEDFVILHALSLCSTCLASMKICTDIYDFICQKENSLNPKVMEKVLSKNS